VVKKGGQLAALLFVEKNIMAKIQAPLFSFGASGTIGKILTFNQSTQKPVARKKPAPSKSAPPLQAIIRLRFKQAAESWRALSPTERAKWRTLAAPTARPSFAKYYLEWVAQNSTPATPPYFPMK
jgi:hypothetical protein